MSALLIAALCSVLVSVLLKLAPRWQVDVGQAVAWNYVAASALAWLVYRPQLKALAAAETPWLALIGLGLLLPTVFMLFGASVRHAGIVRSDVAQRLSLVLSLAAAFFWFRERGSPLNLVGFVLGLLSLMALIGPRRDIGAAHGMARWLYPLGVFVGYGLIDILLKRVAQAGVSFTATLLGTLLLSMLVAFVLQLLRVARGLTKFTASSALAGLLLGLLNFGNILFYLRGHQALPKQPAVIFASMNLGVVVLGTLAGAVVFRERLSALNLGGLVLAVVAIVLIAAA